MILNELKKYKIQKKIIFVENHIIILEDLKMHIQIPIHLQPRQTHTIHKKPKKQITHLFNQYN